MVYSLISATIPSLRPFVTNLSTHYGAGLGPADHNTYGSTLRSESGSGSRSRTINSSRLSYKRPQVTKEAASQKSLVEESRFSMTGLDGADTISRVEQGRMRDWNMVQVKPVRLNSLARTSILTDGDQGSVIEQEARFIPKANN
jgi:hypothetical protein